MSIDNRNTIKRRVFLQGASLVAAGLAFKPLHSRAAETEAQDFSNGTRELVAYPQKRPLMRVTARPPHLETPFSVFNESILTPNDAFFVRYHLANLPTSIDADNYQLQIKGLVDKPLSLSLAELKALGKTVEVVAVNQCSGNSRGYGSPRVFGAQLGNGSVGNARWTGIPLKAVLEQAGVQAGAKQVTFRGLDHPVLPTTPEFIKALGIDLALSDEPMIAWAMNGTDIPFLNGYPIKLIVPGYFGTYWVKHLSEIEVIDHTFEGYFMEKAYRVPDNDCQCVPPGTVPDKTRPIGRLKVRSFITSLQPGAKVKLNEPITLKGFAFDGGHGIQSVELSEDGGRNWQLAVLGENLGNYSFREWTLQWVPREKGKVGLQVRATNGQGEQQPVRALWNPAIYVKNNIETTPITVV
ncbi:protein-methionine-sulfoxide reductase catalytic subunit MsrP [Pseudomonas sp. FW306-02-F02-AA]|uniref:Oxidase n=1 Tax=Pseudomonas fluorescens TaxID=294 RepID=A0A0N9VWQ2_PSEFL|nr:MULTISPECIES: molybdopterin-dependent oxidoreductase [Pseudomonas]ALI02896.1 oxidase [Pseudomonas fluorescens]PMZ04329.1 protein-methionine-sulfoxide reductase catalytic subunit MsrP [Pseudomonas sp. FW306-02-F02-AB]PMZ10588.1 protein-methionine-sulfoxide reductase catalytic subunit MsrP [Pseudomonas sp. FW306-02-H06C]PMZ15982.1 protein-methionine-sulfoxide reductase catalytic subunit MsrP [Pseudomonas sp. FW306-02-F02-AA]PMZ21910.1 protein-methionine-sulfoxide reductase catalytic subunit M